ncbi:hypothetical protein [Corynebacterium occultum]|uniref:hypothetical protein n=1 Tax=Corynebacterium occultum TaxID=2675219 RepID=UPI0018CE1882|nr:hypothetical protein [Corynebacterium occultum]
MATGVTAMAAIELLSRPLGESDVAISGSTLYFYAREVVAHAWMFHGAVHRPHQGRDPRPFRHIAISGEFLNISLDLPGHIHPLSNTGVLHAARARGVEAVDFGHLVHQAAQLPLAREIFDARARLLVELIRLAVDVVGPDSLVFAGEAFTLDPQELQLIIAMLREHQGGPGDFRIQRAGRNILRNAARQVALYRLWQDPLATLSSSPKGHGRP